MGQVTCAWVLHKASMVLGAFDQTHRDLALAGLVARCGLPRSTVHRLAEELVRLGWLTRDGGRYRIGRPVFELAGLVERDLREAALPYMEDLYETTHHTVHLAVLDGSEVIYISKISGHFQITSLSRVGGRMPAYCTGVGKMLLAVTPDAAPMAIAAGLPARTTSTITSPSKLLAELAMIRENG